jgi:hypothetical protein
VRIVVHVCRRGHVLQQVQHAAQDPEGRLDVAGPELVAGQLIEGLRALGGVAVPPLDGEDAVAAPGDDPAQPHALFRLVEVTVPVGEVLPRPPEVVDLDALVLVDHALGQLVLDLLFRQPSHRVERQVEQSKGGARQVLVSVLVLVGERGVAEGPQTDRDGDGR